MRVGLAAPNIPYRTLAEFARDFNIDEVNVVSHGKVRSIRDAFGEAIKDMNRQLLVRSVSALESCEGAAESLPIFVTHVHDEALL